MGTPWLLPHELTCFLLPAEKGPAEGDTEGSLVLAPLTSLSEQASSPPVSTPPHLSCCCLQFLSISLSPFTLSHHVLPAAVVGPWWLTARILPLPVAIANGAWVMLLDFAFNCRRCWNELLDSFVWNHLKLQQELDSTMENYKSQINTL